MNPTSLPLWLAVCAALTPLAGAQQTYIVDLNGGPGAHFSDLPLAEAAAQDGDTLILRAANNYTPVTTSKGLTILGEGNPAFGPGFTAPFQVVNLPAGRRFVMKGVVLASSATVGALKLDNCLGRVHLENVLASTTGGLAPAPALEVNACQSVTLNVCTLTGAPGLLCRYSTVAVAACVITGLASTAASPSSYEGATIDAATAVFTNPQLSGGRGSASAPAAPGLVVLGSLVTLASTGPAFVAAGANGLATSAVTGNGVLITDPRIPLIPAGGAPPVSGVTEVPARTPALLAHSAPPGSPVVAELDAPQGDLFVLLAGRSGDPLPVSIGTFWLQPSLLIFLASGVMDGSERFGLVLPIPPEVALGFPLAFQALCGPGINLALSSPALAVLH